MTNLLDGIKPAMTAASAAVLQAAASPDRPAAAADLPAAAAPAAAPAPVAGAPATADLTGERERAQEIATLALNHNMPAVVAHIGKGTSLDAVRKIVLDAVAAKDDSTRLSNRSPATGADVASTSASWDRAMKRAGAPL